ncbi:MAG: hypothetical protein CVV64_07200 [Candidatus Wallbacteria bacterium HGW-Wallbacteria-1]|jgi:tetratricopeptide (TPR) repeat protein|uniref:Uncharacterized protein n=1 Tax=Candidatus Wallbacteria bacterium HGW-Wallbacteria-1 TaxID=2013854 RepID=A0A2N1PT71_9BACT|nr:MAG: hypothetical protein CVV64_07200 [Candidatus Wallbacteria bacterium HGW-Wallbacteria-1]
MFSVNRHISKRGREDSLTPFHFFVLIFIIVFACLILNPSISGEALDREASEKWFSMGKYFHTHGRDSLKAVECLQRALASDSSNEAARTLLNEIRSDLGLATEVKSVDRDQSRGWLNKGRYLANFKRDLKGAMEAYEKALIFDPGNSEASTLLEEARKQARFTLETEHAIGLASEDFSKAEKALSDSDLLTALESYRRGIVKFPNNTLALLRFFRLAQNLGRDEDIHEALRLIGEQSKFAIISSEDLKTLSQELSCFTMRCNLSRRVSALNRDRAVLEIFLDEFSASFLTEDFRELTQYRQELTPMRVLDVDKLVARGYLSERVNCPGGGGTLFLNEGGMVECTVHGIVEDVRSISALMTKDYASEGGSPADDREQSAAFSQDATAVRSRDVFNSAITLGDIHFKAGRYSDALRLYQKAIDTDSSDPVGYNKRGNALLHYGDLDGALIMYRTASDRDKYFHEAYSNAGICLARQEKYREAAESLSRAIALADDRAEYHYNLGLVYAKMVMDSEACESLSRACELNPEDFASRYQLALILARLRRIGDAIRELKVLRRSDDLKPRILGVLNSMINDLQKAEKRIAPPRGK